MTVRSSVCAQYKRPAPECAEHRCRKYLYLKENPSADFIPKTYIFGARLLGYYMAKQMIRMICKLGDLINNDPAVRDKLRVVYLEEYCVSLSEHLMPAAEVSGDRSLWRAPRLPGTGNAKVHAEPVLSRWALWTRCKRGDRRCCRQGAELIFRYAAPGVNNLGMGYHPNAFIMGDDVANSALNFLERGWNGENLRGHRNLRIAAARTWSWPTSGLPPTASPDLQTVCRPRGPGRAGLRTLPPTGIFSADRAVLDYARDIWYASPVPMGK